MGGLWSYEHISLEVKGTDINSVCLLLHSQSGAGYFAQPVFLGHYQNLAGSKSGSSASAKVHHVCLRCCVLWRFSVHLLCGINKFHIVCLYLCCFVAV